jgi:uncharacterized protein
MISLNEQVTIPSPPEVVWPLLADPGLVASCIPGATMTPAAVLGVYAGTLRVKFGPTVAVFRGEARLSYDHDARRVTVEGRGIDARGQVESSFSITGPLETFANAGGIHVARALLAEFAENMARLLTTEGMPAPEAEEIPMVEPQTVAQQARIVAIAQQSVPAAAELRGGAVLWRAFLGWLRQVFSGKGQHEEPR